MNDPETDQPGNPFSGENVTEVGDDAPEGAVAQTPTQFLDAEGQPLAPPPGH